MLHEALSIRPQNAEKLQDVERLLRQSRAKLTGPKGENISIPEPLYSLLKEAVRNLTQGRSLVLIPREKQLTTQQAGDLPGMCSRADAACRYAAASGRAARNL